MPGDKFPERNPDLGLGGKLFVVVIVAVVLIMGFGWALD